MHVDPYATTVFERPTVTIRRFATGELVSPRRHAGVELVTIMLHGRVVQLDEARRVSLGADDIAVRWAGCGTAIALHAEEPSALFELSLRGRTDLAPGVASYTRPRMLRVERWDTLATTGSATVRAIILPVGVRTALRVRGHVVSTIGRISVGDRVAEPGVRIAVNSNTRITALESTEIVAVTLR